MNFLVIDWINLDRIAFICKRVDFFVENSEFIANRLNLLADNLFVKMNENEEENKNLICNLLSFLVVVVSAAEAICSII